MADTAAAPAAPEPVRASKLSAWKKAGGTASALGAHAQTLTAAWLEAVKEAQARRVRVAAADTRGTHQP
jgi:hypothetical protein